MREGEGRSECGSALDGDWEGVEDILLLRPLRVILLLTQFQFLYLNPLPASLKGLIGLVWFGLVWFGLVWFDLI